MSIAKESLQKALIILTSHESAKVRLKRAWVERLDKLGNEDVPDCIREQFASMRKRLMARRPINGEHPIAATIRKMSLMEASDLNGEIVRMYTRVMNAEAPVQLRVIDSVAESGQDNAVADTVPDFLARH